MYGKNYITETVTTTVGDAVSEAFATVTELCDEMSEWRDNLEEKFSQTERYSRVSDTVDQLEEQSDEPDVPDTFATLPIEYHIGVKRKSSRTAASRASRLGNAVNALRACIDVLQGIVDEDDDDSGTDDEKQARQDRKDEAEQLVSDIETACDNLDGIEFPSAFG